MFESKKVSVLVADPKHTKVNVKTEAGNTEGNQTAPEQVIIIEFYELQKMM